MKALVLSDSRELVEKDMPQPSPAGGEVLVRVHAAGVTPTELLWYPTTHTKSGETRSNAIPGHEFSGVVAGSGAGDTSFEIGQEVYGFNDWFAEGAMADYCVAPPAWIAPKPRGLTHVECAAVPISALTAWQALFVHAKLRAGERVLVHGGAGSVGAFAIQLARLHGAEVVTTVSARNREFVTELGAEKAIDYHATRFEEIVTGIDVVIDTVGGDTLERSWKVLKPGGRLVTIAAAGESANDERVKQAFFIVEPDAQQLSEVAALLEAGRLRPGLDAVVPFAEAAEAFGGRYAGSHGRGKLVVAIAD